MIVNYHRSITTGKLLLQIWLLISTAKTEISKATSIYPGENVTHYLPYLFFSLFYVCLVFFFVASVSYKSIHFLTSFYNFPFILLLSKILSFFSLSCITFCILLLSSEIHSILLPLLFSATFASLCILLHIEYKTTMK